MNITKEVRQSIEQCPDYLSITTAWEIQKTMNEYVAHDSRCSSVPGWHPLSGPAFLCDCGGVEKLYLNIKNL